MKMILKVLALPVLLIVKLVCVLGNLLTNISSYIVHPAAKTRNDVAAYVSRRKFLQLSPNR